MFAELLTSLFAIDPMTADLIWTTLQMWTFKRRTATQGVRATM